jgi:plasmid stabilization system protein ParE
VASTNRFEQQVDMLVQHPQMGRPGRLSGTRVLVISRTPFIVVYRVKGTRLEVSVATRRVTHTAIGSSKPAIGPLVFQFRLDGSPWRIDVQIVCFGGDREAHSCTFPGVIWPVEIALIRPARVAGFRRQSPQSPLEKPEGTQGHR